MYQLYNLNRSIFSLSGGTPGNGDNENNNHNKNTFLLFLLLVGSILYFLYLLKDRI